MTTTSKLIALWRRTWHPEAKTFLVLVMAGSVLVAGYALIPSVYDPYVRVGSSTVTVALRCVPQTIQVESLTKHAAVKRADILLKDVVDGSTMTITPLIPPRTWVDGKIASVLILQQDDVSRAGEFILDHGNKARIHARIEYAPAPYIDLRAVTTTPVAGSAANADCNYGESRGEALLRLLERQAARIMRYSLIQDQLSDLLLSANEVAGNLILASMLVWTFVLAAELSSGLWRSRLAADETVASLYDAHRSRVPQELAKEAPETIVNAVYMQVFRRLSFARVLGPALGFMLTVSSLVAGLHPSTHATHDTFYFISSLQIALVATFMGLAIRVLAEFAIRTHRRAGDRMIDLVIKEKINV